MVPEEGETMVLSWVRKGLRTGVVTTRYPAAHDQMPQAFRGRPVIDPARCLADQGCSACVQVCLPGALHLSEGRAGTDSPTDIEGQGLNGTTGSHEKAEHLTLDLARCIMCGLCVSACPADALHMTQEYELAASDPEALQITLVFDELDGLPSVHGKGESNGTSV
jgi:hydrogenase-4 component H